MIKETIFKALAFLFLLGGVVAGVETLFSGGSVQDAGLCLFVGAMCAALFQCE